MLIVVPSLDTPVCSLESQKFNARLAELPPSVKASSSASICRLRWALVRRARRCEARDALRLPRSQLRFELRLADRRARSAGPRHRRHRQGSQRSRTSKSCRRSPTSPTTMRRSRPPPPHNGADARKPSSSSISARNTASSLRGACASWASTAKSFRTTRRGARSALRESRGADPLRRTGEHARRRCARDGRRRSCAVGRCRFSASVTACSSLARELGAELVNSITPSTGRRRCIVAIASRRSSPASPGIARLDVARRLGRQTSDGYRRAGIDGALPYCSDGQREDEDLRHAVPSRGRAHRSTAGRFWRTFLHRSPACATIGRWIRSSSGRSTRFARSVGSDKVICALSGGVDSAVAATLVARAIGEQLTCIFVDHGLLRKNEAEQVLAAFRDVLHLNVVAVDARERFLSKLRGVEDPERKRVIIGHEFIASSKRKRRRFPASSISCRARSIPTSSNRRRRQSKAGHKIKSHHNVGGLPEKMDLHAGRTAARAL